MKGGWLRAAGAWGQCAPTALDWRFWAAPQLHRSGAPMYRVTSGLQQRVGCNFTAALRRGPLHDRLDERAVAPTPPMTFTDSQIVEILKEGGKTIRRASTKCLNPASHPGLALTVCEVCALSDLDNISVRIAHVAANLAVLGNRLRDELGPSTLP